MKFITTQNKLNDALSRAARVVTRNSTLPLLSCILLEAEKDVVVVRSSNLDLGVEIRFPARVEKPGTVAVSGSVLSNFVSLCRDDRGISFSLEEGELVVSGGGRTARIKRVPHEEFPVLPQIRDGARITLEIGDLLRALRAVFYSASLTALKPELASVFLKCGGGSLVCAATDAFRLAEKRLQLKKEISFDPFLLPVKSVADVVRIFDGIEGDTELAVDKNQCSIACGDIYLTSRLIDGVFPDYEQFMPTGRQTEVVVLRHDFLNALKATSIFSDQFHQVSLRIGPAERVFEVETKNADIGAHTELLQAALEGDDVSMRFNGRYLMDPLQTINSDSIILRFNGAEKPVVLSGVGDQSFRYLVMPMNR